MTSTNAVEAARTGASPLPSSAGAPGREATVRDLMAPPDSKENSEPRTPSSLPASERGPSQHEQQHQQSQQQLLSPGKPCRPRNLSQPTLLLSPAKPLRSSHNWASLEVQKFFNLPGRSPVPPKSPPFLSPICSRAAPKTRDSNGV